MPFHFSRNLNPIEYFQSNSHTDLVGIFRIEFLSITIRPTCRVCFLPLGFFHRFGGLARPRSWGRSPLFFFRLDSLRLDSLRLPSTPFDSIRLLCRTIVERSTNVGSPFWNFARSVWMLIGGLVNSLVPSPSCDLQIFNRINGVELYKTIRRQFVEHSSNVRRVNVVRWEDLRLDALDRARHPTAIIAEIPQANEHQPSDRRTFHDLSRGKKFRLDGPDACHLSCPKQAVGPGVRGGLVEFPIFNITLVRQV